LKVDILVISRSIRNLAVNMPFYQYNCNRCYTSQDELRTIKMRDDGPTCGKCGYEMYRVIVPPAVHTWSQDRKFPHMRGDGDGTMSFPTKAAYESHLKAEGIAEIATDGPILKPHGNKVIWTDGRR
jgi:putative FmdB family regulatory protein